MKCLTLFIPVALLIVLLTIAGLSVLSAPTNPVSAPPTSLQTMPSRGVPTQTPAEMQPQVTPTTRWSSRVATPGRVVVLTPSPEWATFRDPYQGFSFQYPRNWHITVDEGKSLAEVEANGVTIAVESYEVVGILKGSGIKNDLLKIDIYASPDFDQFGNDLDRWDEKNLESYVNPRDPVVRAAWPTPQHVQINKLAALSREYPDPYNAVTVVFGKGKWLYQIGGMPGSSIYRSVFDRVVSSFEVP